MRSKKEFLKFRIDNMINLVLLSQHLPGYDIRDIDSIIDHFKNGNLGLNPDEEKPLRKRLKELNELFYKESNNEEIQWEEFVNDIEVVINEYTGIKSPDFVFLMRYLNNKIKGKKII